MKDRRQSARNRSLLQGRVYYNRRRVSIDCLVRDISGHGAKLVFAETVAVPDVVELYLPGKEELHRVVVQWRKGNEIGVDFEHLPVDEEHDAAAPAADLLGRLLKLEGEVASLKRTINALRGELRTRSEIVCR
jgi:hypothetical protein